MFGWLSDPGERDSRRKRCGERRIGGVERRELLQRDQAVEVGLAREVDDGHAAAPDLAQDLVAADRAQNLGHVLSMTTIASGITALAWRLPARVTTLAAW